MLEWALRYIQLGWPVIPLRPHDARGPKSPQYPNGEPLGKLPNGRLAPNGSKDATLSEAVVRRWWAEEPRGNIGLATGHGWFAVDVDIKKGGDETWDMLSAQYARIPETIIQVTGTGGRHLLFLEPADFKVQNSVEKLGPGIDVRGAGGYIVACPSIHPETKRPYDWDGMEDIEQQRLGPAPLWLLRLLREAQQRKPQVGDKTTPEKIAAGGRNDALFRTASYLRRLGWTAEEIFASLREVNQRRCNPPLDETELRTISASAARYAPDAKANVFAQKVSQTPNSEESELPLTMADVEAAVLALIEKNDLAGVFRAELVEQVAKLKVNEQALLKARLKLHFKDAFSARDFERSVKEFSASPQRFHSDAPPGGYPPTGLDLTPYPDTDSGNGERLVALFGHEIRWCIEMEKWLVWDGKRWAVDDAQDVTQKAKQMARLLYAQVKGTHREKHARQSESAAAIAAALRRAATEPGIAMPAAMLDQNAYLLNCQNGVVDLRTGKLLPHDRELLITKLCKLNYEPKAECRQFLDFIHWAMGAPASDAAELNEKTVRLIAFLQRAFGYSLTGDVSEKVVFICWGEEGNNGKTTLLTLFRELLGEYSTQILIDSLMTQRGGSDATLRADLADLRGARFVMTSEVEKEHKLSEGTLKRITAGQGKIKSRRLYENLIEFDGTHKLFMDCNHRPVVRGQDNAIWRRLLLIPFEVSIPDAEIDKQLPAKLLAEGAGILAWAVRGCMWWMKDGLGLPPEMKQAGQEWREHDDPLADFLEDCCEVDKDASVPSARLSSAYIWWCKREHEKWPLGRDAFLDRIHLKGFKSSRSRRNANNKQYRSIEGLRLRSEVEAALDAAEGGFTRRLDE